MRYFLYQYGVELAANLLFVIVLALAARLLLAVLDARKPVAVAEDAANA